LKLPVPEMALPVSTSLCDFHFGNSTTYLKRFAPFYPFLMESLVGGKVVFSFKPTKNNFGRKWGVDCILW
jgi:hypothetical protein